jgi:hypothetical protein
MLRTYIYDYNPFLDQPLYHNRKVSYINYKTIKINNNNNIVEPMYQYLFEYPCNTIRKSNNISLYR